MKTSTASNILKKSQTHKVSCETVRVQSASCLHRWAVAPRSFTCVLSGSDPEETIHTTPSSSDPEGTGLLWGGGVCVCVCEIFLSNLHRQRRNGSAALTEWISLYRVTECTSLTKSQRADNAYLVEWRSQLIQSQRDETVILLSRSSPAG